MKGEGVKRKERLKEWKKRKNRREMEKERKRETDQQGGERWKGLVKGERLGGKERWEERERIGEKERAKRQTDTTQQREER